MFCPSYKHMNFHIFFFFFFFFFWLKTRNSIMIVPIDTKLGVQTSFGEH